MPKFRTILSTAAFFVLALLLGAASSAHAGEFCSETPYFGVVDGTAGYPIGPAITIDTDCTFQNFTVSNPLTATINFQTNDPSIYLIIFDNVYYDGNMACANIDHRLWVVNSPPNAFSGACQDIFIPVETIAKQAPATSATIGVPFTYTLTLPSMQFPVGDPSSNDLHTVTLWDDLTATGVDLTYAGINAYYKGSGAPVTLVPETNPLARGGVWTPKNLSYEPIPLILAGEQIVVEITVVLDDTATNVAGAQFINTAKWWFGRLIDIDGVPTFFDPLPGEWGVAQPMTIAEPDLVVTKTSNETILNLGVRADFTIDVQNTGGSDAWNATILDQLPDFPLAGMCDYDPTTGAGVSAQIFEADGITPVSALLIQGVDFTATYSAAPTCQLSLTMLTPAAVIGPSQRLVVTYQSELDADTTGEGILLTNVAGATEWFSDDNSFSPRTYTRTLSNGTPLVADHEDSYTITTALSGYVFHKTVMNRTTGANPTATAAPGDTLRYRLRLFNVDQVFTGITMIDQLDPTKFDLNSFAEISSPGNVTVNYNSATGQLDVVGNPPPLNLAIGGEIEIEFDITLLSTLSNLDVVSNQATLNADGPFTALSDDPAGGIVLPPAPGEPTLVVIHAPGPLLKANTQASATIGEQFKYTITVPESPVSVPLYDVRILDDLSTSNADIRFVSANVISGGSWTLSNTSGSATNLIIEDTITGIDIPANGQAVIEITVELLNTTTNNSGDPFNNNASFTYNRTNNVNATQNPGGAGATVDMTVVEPNLNTVSKVGTLISPAPVSGGSIIEYVISMTNGGNATAFDVNVVDNLPAELALYGPFTPTASIGGAPVVGFEPAPIAGAITGQWIWGQGNGDGTLDIPAGDTLTLTYRAQVQTSTAATFNNEAWIDWTSLDNVNTSERTGANCPAITAPDDYCATAISAPLTIIDNNSLNKAVIADSWITDGSTAVDKTVRIGDTATYRLTLNLGESTTNSVTVSDVLPTGMVFESLVSITPASVPVPTSGDFNYTVVSQPAAGDSGTLVWDLGDVVNTPSNDGTPTDALVIEYIVRVIENNASTIAQAPSTTLTNTATLAYVDSAGLTVVDPPRLESQDSITVLQPVMTTVSKTGNALTNTVATPLNVNVATDTVQFHLESCNTTGLAPSYSVLLRDVLATQLDETSLTVPVVTANGGVLTAVTDYTYTPPAVRGGTVQIELLTPVNPGQCVTVDYDIGFHTDFAPNQTWNNSVTVDEYWSLPVSSGQQYSPLGPAQFFMTNIVGLAPISKVVSSPASGEITIGETAVYTITVPVNPIGAVMNNVVVTDILHAALTYTATSATAVDGGGAPVALGESVVGQTISLTIAQIPAGEQVIITLPTRLANNAAANAGVSFTNAVSYTSTEIPGPTSATSGALTIVEPSVVINKSVNPNVPPNPGDILTYSLTFTASSGANFSNAFDLRIDDSLSLGLAYQNGTATVDGTGNTIIDPTVTGDGIAIAQDLTWDLAAATADIDIIEGTTVTVTYDVLVLGSALPGQNLTNSARAQWTGLDGIDTNERTGSGSPVENDYFTAPVTTTLTMHPGALLKETTQATAYVGEQFTYRITVPETIQPAALNDVRILDNLNISTADTVDMTFVSVSKVSPTGTWIPGNTSGDLKNLIIEDTTGGGIDIPAGEQAIVDITVVLNDSAINTSGNVFNNTADYTYNVTQDPGLPSTSGDMTIIGPDTLTLEKSGPATMRVGTPENFILNIQNVGTGLAWDLTITDILPTTVPGGMCDTPPANITAEIFLADGTTSVGPLVAGTDYTTSFIGCTLTITMQSTLAAIDPTNRLIVNYDAALDIDSIGGTVMTNTAAATQWFSGDTGGAGPTGQIRTYTGTLSDGTVGTLDEQDAHSLTVESPVLIFSKRVVNATTGQDPGENAQPGETLRYTLYVENTSVGIPLSSFSLLDELDALNVSALFVPGSLNITSVLPPGAVDNTDPTGGVNGTGLLDVSNLSLAGADGLAGGADTVEVVFEVTLVPVINSGTVVLNQAQINAFGAVIADSDDPNVIGDEDPTRTLITSAPVFQIQKISTDITGAPAVLEAGDTLRYTLTVKNIGNENTVNTLLSDQIPANTTYVAGSTTLNALPVADPSAGVSALTAGLLINAPEITTVGFMRADVNAAADNVATITFDVLVNTTVIGGTVISNQGFVSGNGVGSGAIPQQPSDDPTTAVVDDPTVDIVGNVAFFDVQKTVAIVGDGGTPGIVDPGDVLRYTITATNFGAVPVTNAVLTDPVPASTQYVANSTTLNGIAVADPSPLIGGMDISSSDLTPPLPSSGAGILMPGQSATIEFDVQVDALATPGTDIINQGFVSSNELPIEPTDADGIDSNGDQPTIVKVGSAPLISITKQVFVVGGGVALAGGELEYVVRVTNTGVVPASNVVITDIVDPVAMNMTYITNSALLNGLPAGTNFAGTTLTADYSTNYGDLPVAGVAELRFRVTLDNGLNIGDTVTNTADASWNVPATTSSADVSVTIGGTPGSGTLNGEVWHDASLDNNFDITETPLAGWSVQLYRSNVLLTTVLTDANGAYQISGMAPDLYELRFLAPGAGSNTASLGNGDSVYTNGPQRISDIIVTSGSYLQDLNLPLWPNGVVYNSVSRERVGGAELRMRNAATDALLPTSCFDDPIQQNQITTQNGFYKFDLNFSDLIECPAGGAYRIEVIAPATGYLPTPSQIIPPSSDATTAAFSVPNCPGSVDDTVPGTIPIDYCEVVASAAVPPVSVLPGSPGTIYHLHLLLSNGTTPEEERQIYNNPIPIDPELNGAVAITKTSSMVNVTKGALVPYTITVNNVYGVPLSDIRIEDCFPAGFKYVAGSARLDGNPVEPLINGRILTWDGLVLQVNTRYTIQLLLVVGSGVSEGEYVNRAQVFNNITGGAASGEAKAIVQVVPDPDFDCTDVIGKVFDDSNLNGRQDKGESGMAGVRVVTTRGLISTTDEHGRFHITCAAVPDEDRGSNFILKLDERSLPTGFRVTTENPRVQRATRGKMMRFNFGATIHRVVRIDIADGAFETSSSTMRLQWTPKIVQLIDELKKAPSVLRLSYLADVERQSLVHKRLNALKKEITKQWDRSDGGYQLVVETEIFWRRGAPVKGGR